MIRAILFPLAGAFFAARAASGKYSRLTSLGYGLLATRFGAIGGMLGFAAMALEVMVRRDEAVPVRAGAGRRSPNGRD